MGTGRVFSDEMMYQAVFNGFVFWRKDTDFSIDIDLIKYDGQLGIILGNLDNYDEIKDEQGNLIPRYTIRPAEDDTELIYVHLDHGEIIRVSGETIGIEPFLCAGPLDINLDGEVSESDIEAFKADPYDWDADESINPDDDVANFQLNYYAFTDPPFYAKTMRQLKMADFLSKRQNAVRRLLEVR